MCVGVCRICKYYSIKYKIEPKNCASNTKKVFLIYQIDSFSQNRDYAEKLFQIDNFVELDRPIAQSVLQMRTDDSVNGFLEGLGEHMIRTGENAISENLIQL